MTIRKNVMTKLASTVLMLLALSACSTAGFKGSPQQMAQANAVHIFEESRLPYGQRIALAQATYRPRLYGLNPYFGR